MLFLFAEPALDLAPGYYRLSQIAQTAQQAGIEVQIEPSCERAIFGAAFRHVPWPSVVEALKADGTLEVFQVDGKWRIRPNPAAESEEAREAKAYLAQLADGYAAPYRLAKEKIDAIYALPEKKRTSLIRELASPKPTNTAESFAALLAQSQFNDSEARYGRVALPQKVTAMMRQGPTAPPLTGPMGALLDLILPKVASDEWKKWFFLNMLVGEEDENMEKRRAILQATQIDLRWHLDPQTGNATYELGATIPFQTMEGVPYDAPCRESFYTQSLAGRSFQPRIDPKALFGAGKFATVESRGAETERLLDKDARFTASLDEETPEGTLSDLLLRTAGQKGWSLLLRPSSFFNVRLPKGHYETFAAAWRRATSPKNVRADAQGRLPERVGYLEKPAGSRLVLDPRFSFVPKGEVLVVQDEQRFMERFADGEPLLSPEIANAGLRGQPVALSQVVDTVAAMNSKLWRTGAMASSVLDVCNPTTFYPFAKLFKASPTFRQAVASVEGGKKAVVLPYESLSPAERSLFAASILAMERISTSRESASSPSAAYAHLTNLPLKDLQLSIERTEGPDSSQIYFQAIRLEQPCWNSAVKRIALSKE